MHLRFERVGGHFAAVCTTAVDLREPTPEVVSAIQRALDAHGVLCFRNQQAMTPEHDFKLAQCFAHDPAEAHPSASSLLYGDRGEPWIPGVPAVRLVGRATVRGYFGVSGGVRNYSDWAPEQRAWHSDGTADTAPFPPRYGLLRAVIAPRGGGGDTLFACTRRIAARVLAREAAAPAPSSSSSSAAVAAAAAAAPAAAPAGEPAFDPPPSLARALYRRPAAMRRSLDGITLYACEGALTASHGPYPLLAGGGRGGGGGGAGPPLLIFNNNLEAVVRPDGSRLGAAESQAYMRRLLAAELNDDRSLYRHRWREGDLMLWDQWATLHTATAACQFGEQERLLHRVRLRGPRAPAPWRPELRARL